MTIEAARILGLDEDLGTVEKGKRADFAIFDEDPYTLTPAELSKAYCDMTVVNGEIVHDVERENEDFLMDMMLHSRENTITTTKNKYPPGDWRVFA